LKKRGRSALFSFLESRGMVKVTLPDGSVRHFEQPVTVAEVAASIGAGLAKAALAGKVDGRLVDTSHLIEPMRIWPSSPTRTPKARLIRHSASHLMAYAVKELFPDAQVTIGPVIEDGFYYDFSYKRPFTPEDLAAIEKRMGELAKKDIPVSARSWDRDEAVEVLQIDMGEHYKAEIIASIPAGQDHFAVPRGRFHRSVPRPARAVNRQDQGIQADEAGRRLLARRFEERDAAAHLRHGLGEEGRPRRPTCTAGRGREARPPQARQAARPVPPAGRGAGHGVLASQGLDRVAADRAVHAAEIRRVRLPGSAHAGGDGPQRCGRNPATGTTTATTCSPPPRKTATTRSSR
jgi:hypothetical protein